MKIVSIFLTFYLFFLRDKLFSGFILNLENTEMWSPPVIGRVARGHVLIGRAGRHSPVAARAGIIRPCRKRKPPPRCPNARVSGEELAALPAAVSHGAAPPCRSCRAACCPRSLLVIMPELRHSSSSHAVRIAAPDGPVRTQLVRAPKPASH
jgi:hypothetical protein